MKDGKQNFWRGLLHGSLLGLIGFVGVECLLYLAIPSFRKHPLWLYFVLPFTTLGGIYLGTAIKERRFIAAWIKWYKKLSFRRRPDK